MNPEASAAMIRRLVVGAGVGCALLALLIGPAAGLEMFGDGSIFSYADAVRDSWAFHWHNISGRIFSYLFVHVPAETIVGLTGNARAGIFTNGLLHYSAPALSLLATHRLDRAPGRPVFVFACLSTSCVLPLVFGFPTEMWMTHALFWPALAAALARAPVLVVYGLFQCLVLTHEGGVVLAAAIAGASALGGFRTPEFGRTAGVYTGAMLVWAAVKAALPPDAHIAGVLGAAAYKFIDLGNLADPAFLLLAAALGAYVILALLLRTATMAAALAAIGVATYWLLFDRSLLAEARYMLRTVLLLATPTLGLLAAFATLDDRKLEASPFALVLRPIRIVLSRLDPRLLAGAVALALFVHAGETVKFVAGWIGYKAELRILAAGPAADLGLGDTQFVSARRIS
ncbi:MAG: hypothetical protein HY059_18125, partial [Proteobacteria bacterium]|nr:hypothetical protein [Pseudomonadota bacterium]